MNGQAPPFAVYPGGAAGRADAPPPGREFQELWFTLARKPWASLVLVPADAQTSAGPLASSLAEVGTRLRETAVTAIVAESMDYPSARLLSELQPKLGDERPWTDAVDVEGKQVASKPSSAPATTSKDTRLVAPLTGRVIIAIQPVVDQPLGIGIAQAADAVVVCIDVGRTRLRTARRTIELIGRERIAGCFLVYGGAG